jgi:hypothetical protein
MTEETIVRMFEQLDERLQQIIEVLIEIAGRSGAPPESTHMERALHDAGTRLYLRRRNGDDYAPLDPIGPNDDDKTRALRSSRIGGD